MRPTENIKRFIENAKVSINPEVKRAALTELVNELEKTKKHHRLIHRRIYGK